MNRELWPKAKIILCFWHAAKNWLENAVKKISRIEDRDYVLKEIGDILYGRGLRVDQDRRTWAHAKLNAIKQDRPGA
jgi:hypothetical protein